MDGKITDERMNREDEQTFPSHTPLTEDSPGDMSVATLAARCMQEMDNYRRGEPSNEQYCLELLRRATVQRDALAWEVMQRRFSEVLLRWMSSHPKKEVACQFDSEDNYVARAFERFWQATVCHQQVAFTSLAAALRYLRACLNAAIMDTLRTYSRPREIPLPEPGDAGEQIGATDDDDSSIWEVIQTLLSDKRELRLAYLLYYCGLKPRDIVRYCPLEFRDAQEIYRLRRNIFDRLIRNADYILWRLDKKDEKSGQEMYAYS